MPELIFSKHAEARMRQRGVRQAEVIRLLEAADEPKTLGGGLLSYYIPRQELKKYPCNADDRLRRLVVVIDPASETVITIIKAPSNKRSSYVGNYRRCA